MQTLTQGIAALVKKNQVTWLKGRATLKTDRQVTVRDSNGTETARLAAEYIELISKIIVGVSRLGARLPRSGVYTE